MTFRTSQELASNLAAYNRVLFRHVARVLPATLLMGAVLLLVNTEKDVLPTWAGALVVMVSVLALLAVAIRMFRRAVALASTESGLVCPKCAFRLGARYATLAKTGCCGQCGEKLYEKP